MIIMIVVAGLLAAALILQDKSNKESPLTVLDKLNATPSPKVGLKAEYTTPVPTTTPIPTTALQASPSAMKTLEGGLMIGDIRKGTGKEVVSGNTMVVNYTGALEDGTKFDSSYDKGQPFEVQIGAGRVIKGWDMGIPGMKEGGIRRLVIPGNLAYGEAGAGNGVIPPNATLIFDVEVIKIK